MKIIKLEKRKEAKPLFAIKLAPIVSSFYYSMLERDRAEKVLKNNFNINKDRLINVIDVKDAKNEFSSILVIYDLIATKREAKRIKLEVQKIDFNIFEIDYNKKIEVEEIIKKYTENNGNEDD